LVLVAFCVCCGDSKGFLFTEIHHDLCYVNELFLCKCWKFLTVMSFFSVSNLLKISVHIFSLCLFVKNMLIEIHLRVEEYLQIDKIKSKNQIQEYVNCITVKVKTNSREIQNESFP